jgi:hypothetical protein
MMNSHLTCQAADKRGYSNDAQSVLKDLQYKDAKAAGCIAQSTLFRGAIGKGGAIGLRLVNLLVCRAL